MLFREAELAGGYVVEPERMEDDRGLFVRTFSAREFADHGLDDRVEQDCTLFNARAGALRWLHYQAAPHGEAKLVRCTRGAIFEVCLYLRPGSASYPRWAGVGLRVDAGRALFVPKEQARRFQTPVDATEVRYQISTPFEPRVAGGVRSDAPAFGIEWQPAPPEGRAISTRVSECPDFRPCAGCC